MKREIDFRLDNSLARHLSWRLAFDPRIWGVVLILFVCALGYEYQREVHFDKVRSILPFLLMPPFILVVTISVTYRMISRTVNEAGPIHLRLDDDGILTKNSRVKAKLPWEEIQRLRFTSKLVMVYQTKHVFFPIPRHLLDAETEAFLTEKVRNCGGRVT